MRREKFGLKFSNVGTVIRQIRQQAGLSLRKLAEKIGCKASCLSKIENNRLQIDVNDVERIGEACRIDPFLAVLLCVNQVYQRPPDDQLGLAILQAIEDLKQEQIPTN